MDTGRVIARRYQLQRLVQRGVACVVYQGFDQVLQRNVAIKVTPPEHVQAYRTALRATAQFSHPNIIGIYDVVIEANGLYIIQEFVDGDDFGALLNAQLTPYDVADLGMQICQALMYASTPSRRVSHGDLTPASFLRDRRGAVRVNNFALPNDPYYFTTWSAVGGNGVAVSDPELPYGQMSDARRDDDTRAVGLLLYQLLAGRTPGATTIEPPHDGLLRFSPGVPRELCDVVARAILRSHPQHFTTPEALHVELKAIAQTLEPAPLPAATKAYPEEGARPGQFMPASAPAVATMGAAPFATAEDDMISRRASARLMNPDTRSPGRPAVADVSMKLAAARQAAFGGQSDGVAKPQRLNLPVLLLSGLVLFALFFALGYWLAQTFIP